MVDIWLEIYSDSKYKRASAPSIRTVYVYLTFIVQMFAVLSVQDVGHVPSCKYGTSAQTQGGGGN